MAQTIHSLVSADTDSANDTDCERGWPRLSTSALFAGDSLLPHFLDSLLVRARLLKQLVKTGSTEDEVLAEVRDEIAANFGSGCDFGSEDRKRSAWAEAYRLELLLLLAEPAARLMQELEYRLSMAEMAGVKDNINLRMAFQQTIANKNVGNDNEVCPDSHTECNLRFLLLETVTKFNVK